MTSITCGLLLCSAPGNPAQLASVEVIDTASNSVTATITIGNLPVGQTPGVLLAGIAISPDGTRAYVSNAVGNQIWAIDTASNQVVATIPTAVISLPMPESACYWVANRARVHFADADRQA